MASTHSDPEGVPARDTVVTAEAAYPGRGARFHGRHLSDTTTTTTNNNNKNRRVSRWTDARTSAERSKEEAFEANTTNPRGLRDETGRGVFFGDNNNNNDSGVVFKEGRRSLWSPDWFACTMAGMTVVFVALVGYGFGSGLFLPPETTPSDDRGFPIESGASVGASAAAGSSLLLAPPGSLPGVSSTSSSLLSEFDRQDYRRTIATLLGLPVVMERASPQIRALDWLAYEDEPLIVSESVGGESRATSEETEGLFRDLLEQRYALVVWYFDQGGPTVWKTLNREASSGWIAFGAGVHECDWKGVDCGEGGGGSDNTKRVVVGLRLSPALGVVLTGTSLSTEIGLLTNLRRMDFSDQRLQGKIPDEWAALSQLETVVLSKNQLQTTIPGWIGEWTNLENLALDGNLLYGTIPSSLGSLQRLKHLELQTNPRLGGRFDTVLFQTEAGGGGLRTSLDFLDLSNTDLAGELPPIELPSLRILRLWNTRGFSGTLPTQIGTWSSLETFSIKESPNLVGTIPTEFGLLEQLRTLEIEDSNFMSGRLPTELGNLSSNLEVISFRYTNQTGGLPVEWSGLVGLERINLMQNDRLEGTVPPEYSALTSLRFLDLRGTDLTGEVPEEVCALESLEEFFADCSRKNDKTLGKIVCLCCVWCHGW